MTLILLAGSISVRQRRRGDQTYIHNLPRVDGLRWEVGGLIRTGSPDWLELSGVGDSEVGSSQADGRWMNEWVDFVGGPKVYFVLVTRGE